MQPYALRNAIYPRQVTPDKEDGSCPLEIFSGAEVATNRKSCHTFGFPVYALDRILASDNIIPKWDTIARIGINLGKFPRHARLVLNRPTGLTSPQFHMKHDEFFETVAPRTGYQKYHPNDRVCRASVPEK
jgi:hypothetical protein